MTRLLLPLLLACAMVTATAGGIDDDSRFDDALHLNELQVIGSHNSYKQTIDGPLLKLMQTFSVDAEKLDYTHIPLTAQLEQGLRGLELDVFNDPQGGHYAQPLGLELVRRAGFEPAAYDPRGEMQQPGFKILHVPDVDFRSSQLTLAGALDELAAWSTAHPAHLPIVVTMNLNDDASRVPGGKPSIAWDAAALDALDKLLIERLDRQRLLTPDDVRGDSATLEAAVTARGWPALATCRGKWLFVIDEAGAKRELYLTGHASLKGRVAFTTSAPGHAESAILVMNEPLEQADAIRGFVRQGYLVRTRADAETIEARQNDRSRFQAAIASGAQVISTDYYQPLVTKRGTYQVQFDPAGYARKNPVTAASIADGHE